MPNAWKHFLEVITGAVRGPVLVAHAIDKFEIWNEGWKRCHFRKKDI